MAAGTVVQSMQYAVRPNGIGERRSRSPDRCGIGFGRAGLFLVLALAGCSNKATNAQSEEIARQGSRLETLQMATDNLRERLDSMDGNLSAVLTPDSDGFSYLSNGALAFTVSLSGLEQKGSAVTAKFQIGNLTSGELVKCWSIINVRKSKDGPFEPGGVQNFSGVFKPGTFNNTSTTIPDTKVSDISALRISSILCERIVLNT